MNVFYTFQNEEGQRRTKVRLTPELVSHFYPDIYEENLNSVSDDQYIELMVGQKETYSVCVMPALADRLISIGLKPVEVFRAISNVVRAKVQEQDFSGLLIQQDHDTWVPVFSVTPPDVSIQQAILRQRKEKEQEQEEASRLAGGIAKKNSSSL